nr:menaquinone-dependent protoporphyrinogen IX dehydrogenase [Shewanella gelidii]
MLGVTVTKALIVYSSVHGQTVKICEYLKQKLSDLGEHVTLCNIQDNPDLAGFDKVMIGASIRHGKHNPAVYEFISRNQAQLEAKPNCFFAVSLVARKPEKNTPETNPYMQAFLQKTTWRPAQIEVLGGNLNYQGYGPMDRNIIRFIMWVNKGPTELHTNVEYTDWQKVDALAEAFHQQAN